MNKFGHAPVFLPYTLKSYIRLYYRREVGMCTENLGREIKSMSCKLLIRYEQVFSEGLLLIRTSNGFASETFNQSTFLLSLQLNTL